MLGRRPPTDSLPGAYTPHKRSTSLLKTPRSGGSLDWDRLMAIIFGATTFMLFIAFLSKGQAFDEALRTEKILQEQLGKYQEEISQLRSTVSHFEQEVDAKEIQTSALNREVNQFRAQSDRLDSMVEGYRGQIHRMEVQLSKKERECKVREEELEATVSKEVTLKTTAEQRVADELKVSHDLMQKVHRIENDLENIKKDLAKCKEGEKADTRTHVGLEQDIPNNNNRAQEASKGHADNSTDSERSGVGSGNQETATDNASTSSHADVL